MQPPAPFVAAIQRVEEKWVDYNGHLNMAYYNVLFDRAGDEAFDLVGLGADYLKKENCSFFTLEAHITYLREMHAGDPVRVNVQFLDYDSKRVHYVEEMYHAEEGWLACVSEHMIIHVDMSSKRTSPFPPEILKKIAAMCAAHKSLPVPPQVGHKIGIPRK